MVPMNERLVWRAERFSSRSDVATGSDRAGVCFIFFQRMHPGLQGPAKKAIVCIEEN
jgi:hypothetical protein